MIIKSKEFSILSESWYKDTCLVNCEYVDELTFGIYCEDGSTIGEGCIRWYEINNEIFPKVELFSDAWNLFNECSELFKLLSDYSNTDLTPNEFKKLLESIGFKDKTLIRSN